MVTKATFVGEGFTRKPPKYERFIRPMVSGKQQGAGVQMPTTLLSKAHIQKGWVRCFSKQQKGLIENIVFLTLAASQLPIVCHFWHEADILPPDIPPPDTVEWLPSSEGLGLLGLIPCRLHVQGCLRLLTVNALSFVKGLRFKKAHVTHPELKATFCLPIIGVKKNPSSLLYTSLGVITKGTVIEVSIELSSLVVSSTSLVSFRHLSWQRVSWILCNACCDFFCRWT